MTFTHAVPSNNFGTAKWIVSSSVAEGTHTTIAAALTSASSGDTIFIRPGTYTENLTLKAGVNLTAYPCDSLTPNVTITGKATFTAAGTVSISGIRLQTNSDFCLAVTGSAASIVKLTNCYINAPNNTAISFTTSSSSAEIDLYNSFGDLGTTGIAIYSHSSAGTITFKNCVFTNSGASTTATSNSAGAVNAFDSSFNCPFSTTSTGSFSAKNITITCSSLNTTALTTNGSGGGSLNEVNLNSGTASALSIGTGVTLPVNYLGIASSNTNAITGAGTLTYSNINFQSNANVNVTTQTPVAIQAGNWNYISTLTASTSANLEFKNLGTYKAFMFVIQNLVPATNATQLQLLVSANNGSTYASTGYTAGINYSAYNSTTVTNVNSTTAAIITSNASNGTGISGFIFCSQSNGMYVGDMTYLSTDTTVSSTGRCGGGTGVVFNAFKFQMSSGNLTSGTITCYGIAI